MSRCWLCGGEAPAGVCLGPHADYQLRGPMGGTSLYVELPGWWPRSVEEEESSAGDGVTASGRGWSIHYDPRVAEAARLRSEREAAKAARVERERAEELALLYRLAAKHGLVVRRVVVSVAGAPAARVGGAQPLPRFGGAFPSPSAPAGLTGAVTNVAVRAGEGR